MHASRFEIDTAAECAFSAVVEGQALTLTEARRELSRQRGMMRAREDATVRNMQRMLAADPEWLDWTLHASQSWGCIGDNDEARAYCVAAYDRAAQVLAPFHCGH